MNYNIAPQIFLAASLLIIPGCDFGEPDDRTNQLVVFSHIESGADAADTVHVSFLNLIEEVYNPSLNGVSGAKVTLWDGETLPFCLTAVPGKDGCYLDHAWQSNQIIPGTNYTLTVRWHDQYIEASTRVPEMLGLRSIVSRGLYCGENEIVIDPVDLNMDMNSREEIKWVENTGDLRILYMDTVVYRNGNCYTSDFTSLPLFTLHWFTDSASTGCVSLVTSRALVPSAENSIIDTSFTANALKGEMGTDEEGNLIRPNYYRWVSASGIVPVNWMFFNYYGPQVITVELADSTMADYLEGGAGQVNPYMMPQSNIDGGYGLFYSSCIAKFVIFVAPDTIEAAGM